ncbi:ankyrin repeat-containing protein [Microsporum canis]|uniref:protein S-acyltransferase n=1 Tax=Arthroderma otae (strain ATCC MYA-4605 / CBS 113480) TaxID=554155 RepID=C5FVI0_ARTOC|nr:ankyrin repeat-containing protein [Microsporum canis CBS 113480]EEQ33914.1 ankyrin repeat-containing protein [Microsporum canis CBS 113480]
MTTTRTVSLPFEAVDDLIYDARAGDLESLQADITKFSQEYNCSPADIIKAAIDTEDESEGGTGSCLLHWPAANGNTEILNYLLSLLKSENEERDSSNIQIINHKNHSGNTPLHWAALNTHLECVKALVKAGADIILKNNAGHDAVFVAEQSDWNATATTEDEDRGEGEDAAEMEGNVEEAEVSTPREATKGQQVVEWLLSCEKGADMEKSAVDDTDVPMEEDGAGSSK